ncbi:MULTISPECIES: sce7725 family protein [Bifidobacterium]|uniref:sce7725 family protein n=1 Tax=Bifidobacterium TaxID=1678 RepID=UPI001BDC0454|nr:MULTISPECIES: sce7725 family protein [Bifidobacterium]MBT1162409.1 sce7725 family protein [Bifidobacterium sp. SO1]MBW3079635.1 sce7725 family protein [Bifidobacterium simiiventris]
MTYYPYLRARQYELLALRELLMAGKLPVQVTPIIEPVKDTPQLRQTMKIFRERENGALGVVLNPDVGDLTADTDLDSRFDIYGNSQTLPLIGESGRIVPAILLNNDAMTVANRVEQTDATLMEESGIVFVSENDRGRIRNLKEFKFHAIASSDSMQLRRDLKRNDISAKRILFSDPFIKRENNAAYDDDDCRDEFFSDDHLWYKDEGQYEGFGDYSIVGDNYDERGGMPKAVAVHIVYFDEHWNLRIHHFVSYASDDVHETPAKFIQAVEKLSAWHDERDGLSSEHMTIGMRTLINHAETGTYPGLPTIKKLSIMHHLELMGWFFSERPDLQCDAA